MKLIPMLAALGVVAGFSVDASAQDGKKRSERRDEKRQALLKKFDKDGDGKLSKQERADARELRSKEGRKGAHKRALRRFDKDGNRRLDRSERRDLRKFRHDRRDGFRRR